MKNKFIKPIFIMLLVIMLAGFGFVNFCQAGTYTELKGQLDMTGAKAWGAQISDANAMPRIIQIVISALLGLLGIIFLVLIIYAGFNWMTAQGDEDKVTLAKNTLIRAVIGLVIIVAAYSITYFVFSNLPAGEGGGGIVGGSS